MKSVSFFMVIPHQGLKQLLEEEGGIVHSRYNEPFDVAVFSPGPEISPFLYGERMCTDMRVAPNRDMIDNHAYRLLPHYFPKVGIARGGQFLSIMSGGSVYQRVDNHVPDHFVMNLDTGDLVKVTSGHSSAMNPPKHCDILAATNMSTVKKTDSREYHIDTSKKHNYNDVEAAFCSLTNSLMFQPFISLSDSDPSKNTGKLLLDYIENWVLPKCKSPITLTV